jgi:methyl-accepting chemotaxis protein
MAQKFSRKKYLINREIQLKYLLLTVAVLVAYTLFLLAAIFVPQMQEFAAELTLAGKADDARVIMELHKTFWPAALAVIALFGVGSILVTHKIVGPLFSIDRTIREMAAGNLTVRAHIRKGDELQEFHHNFNAMADNLERLLIDLERGCRCMGECGEALEREIDSGRLDSPEIAKLLVRLKGDREKFCREMQRYSFRRDK